MDGVGLGWTGLDGLDRVGRGRTEVDVVGRGWKGGDGVGRG